MTEQTNYFDVGTREDIVISNSSLSAINPEEGGSPQKFLSFFDKQPNKKTKFFERGDLLHNYLEDKGAFIVSETEKPTDMLEQFLYNLYRIATNQVPVDNSISTMIVSDLKKEDAQNAYILKVRDEYKKIAVAFSIPEEDVIAWVRQARIKEGKMLYSSYKEDTFLALALTGKDYFNFLIAADGKIAMTKADKEAIDSAIKSIEANQAINKLLADSFDDDIKIFREYPVYFTINITVPYLDKATQVALKAKVKLDFLKLNLTKRKATYVDHKSTSKSVYLFRKSFEEYNYDRQHGFYHRGIRALLTQLGYDPNQWEIEHYNMVAELTGLYLAVPYKVTEDTLFKGATEKVNPLLKRIAYHKLSGIWNMSMEEAQNNGIIVI